MQIHIERETPTKGMLWAGRRNFVWIGATDAMILRGILGGIWLFIVYLAVMEPAWLVFAVGGGIIIAVRGVPRLLRWRRQVRWFRGHSDGRMVSYVTLTDGWVVVGLRDLFETRWVWEMLSHGRVRRRRLDLNFSGYRVSVDLDTLSEAQVAQIKRRIRVALGDGADACPSCGYDLRATAGPRCPECGAVVGEERSASPTPTD
ncbi:MAG: hypothetical protein WD009_00420 [Phycisphaeraceae bacterium]